MLRMQCNEAKRCRTAGKCEAANSADGKFVYESRMATLQEAAVVDKVQNVRSDMLGGIDWLSKSGFGDLVSELEAQLRTVTI